MLNLIGVYGDTPLPKSKKMDSIFKDNPGLDVAYKTADGKYFYTENGAQNYALTLKDQAVKKVVRTEKRGGGKRGCYWNRES